eukprot:TRINITY_DN32019_c0_g1_i1.p1 TRINITY_DN32019_c0_g1~~TRINITY_DN32019_c0_g1_i1.p1  ORF type:complete len:3749 (+),score=1074.75 TRINITY_DN32019_c0_g1_i1:85-11331(+)
MSWGQSANEEPAMLSQDELTFVVTPPRILFRGYEPFRTYEASLKFKNQTKQVQSVRVVPPESRFFGVSEPRGGSMTLRVARGLSVSYTVRFRPEEDCDYDCDLVVVTDKERFIVEVRALASRGRLDLPPLYSFPSTPIKHREERAIFVRNVGAKPAQWTVSVSAPWTITPEVGYLEPGAPPLQLVLAFQPTERRRYEGLMLVSYSNGDSTKVLLEGSAVDVTVTLSRQSLALAPTFISLERQETVTLFNRSDVTVFFQWKAHETAYDEQQLKHSMLESLTESHRDATVSITNSRDSKRQERRRTSGVVAQARELKSLARAAYAKQRQIEESPIAFEHAYFTIEPLSGQIPAKSRRDFTVTFNPQMATTCEVIAFMDVVGRADRLPLTLKGQGIGPQCQFSYDALDLGDVFINSIHHYEVILENRGSIEARYSLQQPKNVFGPKFRFTPSHAAVPPGQTQVIEIEFCSDVIGILSEAFHFTIQGAKDDLVLHFKGRVIGPTFHCDVDEIDFGNVSYNFMHRRSFNLVNTSEIPMRFHLRVPEDTGREFDIIPAAGLVLPHGKKNIQLEFLSDTVHEYNAHLVVDIDEVGDNLYSVPVKATCIVPDITVTRDALDFGRGSPCFVGHPYTMEIEVKNDTQLSCKYDVGLPADDDPIRRKVTITVNQKKGVVNARSTHQIAVTLTAKMVGSVHLPIYIRILGSEKRIPVSLSARVTGPVVSVDHSTLDFGRVNVLEEHCRKVELNNTSPIPAMFSTRLLNKTSTFSLKRGEGTIPKHGKWELPIYACLDETVRFFDELVITIANSRELVIKLSAIGTGTTLVPSIPLNKDVDFGNVFTTASVQRSFVMHNKGRRALQISWTNERAKPKEGEPPITFMVQPERATIAGKGEQEFVIEGSNARPGKAWEKFVCKLTKTHKMVFKLNVVGTFVVPLLEPSDRSLHFAYSWEREGSGQSSDQMQQSRPLTLRNVSPLTLDFSLKVGPPFTIDRADCVLREHESCTVYIEFDAGYRRDRISHKLKTKLTVSYRDHPQKESVELSAEVHFPNVSLDLLGESQQPLQITSGAEPQAPQRPVVDFGCVMHETERRAFMTVLNTSKVQAKYSWVFEDAPAEHSRPPTDQKDKRPAVVAGPSAGLFDVLPIRGFLRPGEAERVEFVFHAQSAVRARAQAVLLVEGGPEYPVLLAGEASTVHFRLDKSALDFGAIQYDRHEERDVSLHNLGKVAFAFQVDLSGLRRRGVVDVFPQQGQVKAGDKMRLVVRFCPQVPDLVDDCFQIQVAHFEPHSINVKGLGLYPNILVHGSGVQRLAPPDVESLREEARALLADDSRRYFLRAGLSSALGATARHRPDDAAAREKQQADIDSEMERLYFTRLIQQAAVEPEPVVSPVTAVETSPSSGMGDLSAADPEPPPYSPYQRKMPSGETKYVVASYTVDFGAVVKGETRRKQVRVSNISHGPLSFVFDKRSLQNTGVVISPEKQAKLLGHPIYAEQALDVQLLTRGENTKGINFGDFSLTVPIDVRGGPLVTLVIKAFIMVPQLTVIPSVDIPLDFDADALSADGAPRPFTTVGEARIIRRQFHNPLPLPCEWVARPDIKRSQPRNKFFCRPDRGVLAPGDRCEVEVHFVPTEGGLTHGAVNIKVSQNPRPLQLICKGTGEAVSLSIDQPVISLGPVLPFVSQDHKITIRNNSQVSVEVFSANFDKSCLVEDEILRNIDALYSHDGVLLMPPRDRLPYHLPDRLLDEYWNLLVMKDDDIAAAMDVPNPQQAPKQPTTPSRAAPAPSEPSPGAGEAMPGNVVLVWGPPVSGKTTIASMVRQKYGLRMMQIDDVIQWIVELDCDEGSHLRNVLAPCDAVEHEEPSVSILADALTLRFQEEDCVEGVVFDGCGSDLLERAGLDRPDHLARAVCNAAAAAKMGFHLVILDVDEGLIDLRKAVQAETAASAALKDAEVQEVPEDEYDAMDAQSRRAHERALKRLRKCKHEARVATDARVRLEKARADVPEPETLLAVIAKEDEARLAAEAEEAAQRKKPPAKKGKEQQQDADELKLEAGTDGVTRFKKVHPFLMRALEMVDKGDPEAEVKRPVLLPQTGPSPGESRAESMSSQAALLADRDGLPFPQKSEADGQMDAQDLAVIPPVTKARIERPKVEMQQQKPKCLQILTKMPARKRDPDAAPAKQPAKGGKSPTPAPTESEPEHEFVNSVTRWELKPKGEPGSEQTLHIRFEATDPAPEGLMETLDFGVVGCPSSWQLQCRGTCAYPEVIRDMKTTFARRRQVRRNKQGTMHFDFGPLLVHEAKPVDAAKAPPTQPKKSLTVGTSPTAEAAPDANTEWLTIQNHELFAADIVWTFMDEAQKTFSVYPSSMHLEPGKSSKVKIVCLPEASTQGGEHEHTLIGLVKDNPSPVQFPLSCSSWRPQVEVDGASEGVCTLNFGKLLLDVARTEAISLRNVSLIPVRWELVDSSEQGKKLRQEFKIEPTRGTTAQPPGAAERKETVLASGRLDPRLNRIPRDEKMPRDRDLIAIFFEATMADVMNCELALQIRDDDPAGRVWQTIKVVLQAEAYNIYAEAPERIVMGQGGLVKVGQEHNATVQLINRGKYPFTYEFSIPARLTRGLSPLFRCNPMKGELAPRDPLKIEVTFDPKQEIAFRGETPAEFEIMIFKGKDELNAGEEQVIVGSLPVKVEVEARYNQFAVRPPERQLGFGPCLFNEKKKMTLDITNTGPFEFRYKLYDQTVHKDGPPEQNPTPEPDVAPKGKPAKPAKGGKAQPQQSLTQLALGAFKVDPAEGSIAPGESTEVVVVLDPTGLPAQAFSEKLGIQVEDYDVTDPKVRDPVVLEGESCVPGIAADLSLPDASGVFEEQQVVHKLDKTNRHRAVFSRESRVFSFGTMLLNRQAQENFKISNPFKVPCTVTITLKQKADTPLAGFEAWFLPPHGSQPSDARTLTAEIAPGTHRYAAVAFKPTEQKQYAALFEAVVTDGTDPSTRELLFEIRGEGALPQIQVDLPPPPAPPAEAAPATAPDPKAGGKKGGRPTSAPKGTKQAAEPPPPPTPQLVFPRTILSQTSSREITVTNVGQLPAQVKLVTRDTTKSGGVFTFPTRGQERTLAPGAVETWAATFEPTQVRDHEAKIAFVVTDSPAEEVLYTVLGEGVDELVTFEQIGPVENLLALDDCGIGHSTKKHFKVRSHSSNVLRFAWEVPKTTDGASDDRFKVQPGVGWLLPGADKECLLTFSSDTADDFSRKPLQLSVWKVRPHAKRVPDWDDRLTAIRWEPDVTPPPTPPAEGEAAAAEHAAAAADAEPADADAAAAARQKDLERRRRPLRRKVETLPEPPHDIIRAEGAEAATPATAKTLFLKAACGWAKWALVPQDDGKPLEAGVRFATTRLFQTRSVSFQLKNTGDIQLRCGWQILNPAGERLGEDEAGRFRIEPENCVVPVEGSADCKLFYAPLDTETHSALLRADIANTKPGEDGKPTVQPDIVLDGRAECPLAHFELAESDYLSAEKRDPALPGPGGKTGPLDKATRVLEFHNTGVRQRSTRRFYILNPTSMSYDFEWQDQTENPQVSRLFSCRTQRGVVHAMKKSEIVFEFTPDSLDIKEAFFNLRIGGSGYFKPLVVPFLLVGLTSEPNLYFSHNRLHLDQVLLNVKSKRVLHLENREMSAYSFAFERPTQGSGLTIAPVSGRVKAESTVPIEIGFTPAAEGPHCFNLVCNVKRKTLPLTCNVKAIGCSVAVDAQDDSPAQAVPADPPPAEEKPPQKGKKK